MSREWTNTCNMLSHFGGYILGVYFKELSE